MVGGSLAVTLMAGNENRKVDVQLRVFGFRLRDVDCDFRLMRRAVFDKVGAKEVGTSARK